MITWLRMIKKTSQSHQDEPNLSKMQKIEKPQKPVEIYVINWTWNQKTIYLLSNNQEQLSGKIWSEVGWNGWIYYFVCV